MGANKSKNGQLTVSSGEGKALRVRKSTSHRVLISNDFQPKHYELKIEVNTGGNFIFTGELKLSGEVTRTGVKEVTLHSKELHVLSATFGALRATKISNDFELNTVTFEFPSKLPKGNGTLAVSYYGLHNDQMAGFYRSEYKDRSGAMRTMVSTQFEALDARRCFPCIDEPGRKATFKPTLVIEDGMHALSNMPVESDTLMDDGKRRKVVFGETPKMSTYLLAFVVCNFDFLEKKSSHGVTIRVYTPPGVKEQGQFALDTAVRTLDFFDDVFAAPYPLPKLDMIAVPQFAMGAMENWGLVTYREVDLLIDGAKASSVQKQRVATVVAHELAHQWFGNLVTMEWWNGLWLNEGFATWMADYCLSSLFPDWQIWEQFVINAQATAMKLDALMSSHPIQVPIAHAEEVEQVFDAISYYKGASVVRLVHSFLGRENFVEGLRKYMKAYQYSNTETSDLWQVWKDVSGLPVHHVMASWTDQMGFPVVTVTGAEWTEDCSSCTLSLQQQWFIADGSEPKAAKNKVWSIPLLATMGGNGGELVNLGIMNSCTMKVTVDVPGKQKTWIKLNGEQHVPMRVNYGPVAEEFSPMFSTAILTGEMTTTDRTGILLDAFALTKAGSLDPGALMALLGAYKNEKEMPVFSAMEDVLGSMDRVLRNGEGADAAELYKDFLVFGRRVISKAVQEVGWDKKPSDGHVTKLLRTSLIRLQSIFMIEDETVQAEAARRFEAFAANPSKNHDMLPSEIKTNVLKIVLGRPDLQENTKLAYTKCMEIIDLAANTQEKKDVYLALGHVNSPELKRKTLDWCTSGSLKKQDFFYPIAGVSGSGAQGQLLAWTYLQENFARVTDMIKTASPSLLAAVVSYSCSGFCSEEKAAEIEAFFEKNRDVHPVQLISRKVDQIVENTRTNAKLLRTIERSETFHKHIKTTEK